MVSNINEDIRQRACTNESIAQLNKYVREIQTYFNELCQHNSGSFPGMTELRPSLTQDNRIDLATTYHSRHAVNQEGSRHREPHGVGGGGGVLLDAGSRQAVPYIPN